MAYIQNIKIGASGTTHTISPSSINVKKPSGGDYYFVGVENISGGAGTTANRTPYTASGSLYFSHSGILHCVSAYEASDERLKTFEDAIPVDLMELSELKKNYFKWNDDETQSMQIGVSAQEIQRLYPELVQERKDGYLSVAYDKLSVVALAAIDKLYQQNIELEKRVKELESLINTNKN